MKFLKKILLFAFILCNTSIVFAQYITVNDTKTAQQLVENVLVNSSCANVSNFAISGDNYTPGQNSYGYFNSGTSNFPFAEGVVLSTWTSTNSIGPFIRNQGGGDSSWLGNPDLEQALGLSNTSNATALEFDFTPLTNFISFDYLFASNEYQDNYPCCYSDGFAFLIKEKGSTGSYQNLAIIPGTTTAVSSKTVHPLTNPVSTSCSNMGCPAINEGYFGGFNNTSGNTNPINYSGQTVVMNAQTTVTAGKIYHVILVVADQGGKLYDSAVFLKAGSFSPKIDFGQDRTLATNNPICFGESFIIDTKLPPTYIYKWYKDGSLTPISGETSPTLTVTDTGTYRADVELGSPTCLATGQIKVEFTPKIVLSNTTLVQCDDNSDGITTFDLTKVDNIIKNNVSTLSPVVYYESLPDAQGKNNPILNPATYKNTNTPPTPVIARVTNTFGCANYAQVNLIIANNSIAPRNPISTCDDDAISDGLYHFDLNAQVTPQVLLGLPSGMIAEYYLISTDAILQKNALPNNFNNTTPNQQTIYARIINGSDCYGIVPITLVVNKFDPTNFQEEAAFVCNGSTTNLSVAPVYSSYLWDNGNNTNSINISTPGNYSVTVTNSNGCKKTKKFNVTASEIATITGAITNDFSGNENSVLIQYTGIGKYEFTLDGTYFQDNLLFTGIAPGTYTAYARDKYGCGLSVPFVVYVLDYPLFFTPNGDGFNDFWKIKNLDLFPKATITIFDRYGKLLKQLNANSPGWNGTYIGNELPADDYWFNLNFEDGKIIKGHFSLKR